MYYYGNIVLGSFDPGRSDTHTTYQFIDDLWERRNEEVHRRRTKEQTIYECCLREKLSIELKKLRMLMSRSNCTVGKV